MLSCSGHERVNLGFLVVLEILVPLVLCCCVIVQGAIDLRRGHNMQSVRLLFWNCLRFLAEISMPPP